MEEMEQDYNHALETLTNTFGNVLSRDVFIAIIENCEGDLEKSANAVMNIIIEGNSLSPNDPQNVYDYINVGEQSRQSAPNVSTSQDNVPRNSTMASYASASQSSKPTLQSMPKPSMPCADITWTTQLRQISAHHETGARILIIMRGVPGSGKSYLAKRLLNYMLGSELQNNFCIHILSTDDFFKKKSKYLFDKDRLSEAHAWNLDRATKAIEQGISPVIIDNTNIEYFEMEKYVRLGVKNGYIIEVVEPNTPWAKKASQLTQRNIHNVPSHTIRRMLEKYENGITGALLMKKFNCFYSHQMLPPVLRNVPPILQKGHKQVYSSPDNGKPSEDINKNSVKVSQATEIKMLPSTSSMEALAIKGQDSNTLCHEEVHLNQKISNKSDKFVETLKCLEEMERVGLEWDNGDGWDDSGNNISENKGSKILPESASNSKPQRRNKSSSSLGTENLIPFVNNYQNWNKISELPPWDDRNSMLVVEKAAPALEKNSCGTCIEAGDDETREMMASENISPKIYGNPLVVEELPSTSQSDCNMPNTSKSDKNEICDDDSHGGCYDTERTVNFNLGTEFIAQLDKLFDRKMEYPKNVNPRINMPMSLLNEINALWMESLTYQIEEDAKQSALMIQQDEEFARELALKEAELSQAGKEPAVPDFKEIMDMDFAVSLYHKDVAECLNNKPLDMAGKLSREKLYNLFPDITPSILSELLAAHDEDFQATVEVLLMSTGKVDVIDGQNGINKFIMTRELERHREKLIEEEKKTLSEVEWPLLPKWEEADMSMVEQYRNKAEKHLQARNRNYQKAQEFIRRGITSVASYYSGVAALHKRKYEQANSLAAASLIQIHALSNNDNSTIDLHYLRVAEAIESVDIFLDTHIQKLREVQDRNMGKCHKLYFITGRGLHSSGGPKIKPAVKRRLLERGLAFSERNPGLLTAMVSANDRMSHQLT